MLGQWLWPIADGIKQGAIACPGRTTLNVVLLSQVGERDQKVFFF